MVLPAYEAEQAIEALETMAVEEVGSPNWMRQHMILQKLNLQAHECVQKNEENFVLEALVTHDKLKVIVHELIVIEAWREKVLTNDQILEHLAENNAIRGYHVAFQEATICNLLEVVLYHDYAAQSCGETILEVVDYCCRRLQWLTDLSMREDDNLQAEEMMKKSAVDMDTPEGRLREFKRQLHDIHWRCSIAAVSVLRFICEHVTSLPLSVMTRLLDTHDVPCMVVPCIENMPWTRRNKQGQWEKLQDHIWTKVEPQDLLLLTPLEAQPWLIMYNLLCEGEVRKRYYFHSFRKDSLLRVRKYLNQTLVDQLPILADLQRTFDEITIMDAPPATTSTALVLEQVAEIRETVLRKTNWKAQVEHVISNTFKTKEDRDDPLIRQLAGLYNDDAVEELLSGRYMSERDEEPVIQEIGEDQDGAIEQDAAEPPKPKTNFPYEATLHLQTGVALRLVPISQIGTEQVTSKGKFLRFQLFNPDASKDQENAGSNTNEGNNDIGVAFPFTENFMFKMVVKSSLGFDGETDLTIYSKPAKALPSTTDFWEKIGALKNGALAQVQCLLDQEDETAESCNVRLGAIFLSLAQP